MKIFMVGPIGKAGGVSTHTKALMKEYEKLDIEVKFYNTLTKRGWRPGGRDLITYFDNFVKFLKIVFVLPFKIIANRKQADIIHVQSSGPLGGFLSAMVTVTWNKILRKKVVVTFHHSKTGRFLKKHKRIFRYVIKNSHAFITVSKLQKKQIRETYDGRFQSKTYPIPNGYDPTKFRYMEKKEARKKVGIDDDTKVFVNVAWVMEKKGHKYLLDSIEILRDNKHFDKMAFYIIGKGPLLEEQRKDVVDRGLENSVEFLGYLPFDDLIAYMRSADYFVLPSLDEGNPIVMFEALSLGLPYVGTDVGGIPEIIDSAEYGILVKPKDPKALAGSISEALSRNWDRSKILEYSKQFTWEKIAIETKEVYERVLKDR